MPQLPNLLPPIMTLPQDDRDPAGRADELTRARDLYRYSYDKANIRGLAMCQAIPDADTPALTWRAGLGALVGRLARNAGLAAGPPGEAAVAQMIKTVEDDGLDAALKVLGRIMVNGTADRRISDLSDYAALFHTFPAPKESVDYFLDSTFARMRLAGPNPAWLRRVDPADGLPADCGFTEADFAAAIPAGDSLAAALAEGRLFLCAYRELLNVQPGSLPVPQEISIDYAADPAAWDAAYRAREASYGAGARHKALVAPLALFAIRRGQRRLTPVAIQLFPDGHAGKRHRVFSPRDGLAWLAAKACVHAADATVHEVISHLGRTHLVQEAFYLALRNNLSVRHPLHRLLVPHFTGTLSINAGANQTLVAPGGFVDQMLLPTIGEAIKLCGQAVLTSDFGDEIFLQNLVVRGMHDVDLDYPYRDDGKLVWRAISDWVTGYVNHVYKDDQQVAADAELQAMVRQVGQYKQLDASGRLCGGGLRGVGEGGARVVTRAYLAKMLTQIIWNGSGQHAAVNFPQAGPMVYAPNFPLALRAPAPSAPHMTEEEYLDLLPNYESAHVQLFVLELLGSFHHTVLGHYPPGPAGASHFGPGPVAELQRTLLHDLAQVEETIRGRNQHRTSYDYLLPSKIPQSINI